MRSSETVQVTTCDRCGGKPCVHVTTSVDCLWQAAGQATATPDLCKRCVDRIMALAAQIRTQRRRTWSEPGGA